MATLVSHRLAVEGFPVRAVYTYGSPRPGNRNFRDAYRLPNYRFVNDNDLVPHLPLRWCFRHVGRLEAAHARWQAAGGRQPLERQEAGARQARQARAAGPSQRRRSALEAGRIRLAGRSPSRRLSGRHCPAVAARSAAAASRVCGHRPGRGALALHRRAGRAGRPPAEDARPAAGRLPRRSRKANWRPPSPSSPQRGNTGGTVPIFVPRKWDCPLTNSDANFSRVQTIGRLYPTPFSAGRMRHGFVAAEESTVEIPGLFWSFCAMGGNRPTANV